MIRFTIFGIPVEVQPFFWISLVLIGSMGGADSKAEFFHILLFVLAGFFSILVHELGHALTARGFGAATSITLQAFGGYAAYSGVRMNRWQSFLITAAGPAIQIALGVVVLVAFQFLPKLNPHGHYFLVTLMGISFFWAILNLLPVIPLDGGQMLNAALGPARIKITLWITILVSITVGLAMFKYFHSFIFPIFLGMFAWQAYQALNEHR